MNDETYSPQFTQEDHRLIKTGEYFEKGSVEIERAWRSRGVTDHRVANAANYWGINYLKTGEFLATPKVDYGYVFFTRPRLRLTYDNLLKNRTFTLLNGGSDSSVASIVRAYLDPVGHNSGTFKCPRVDKRNPFIPILTNNLESLSGFPDNPIEIFSYKEGIMGETVSLADGRPVNLGNVSITASFTNVKNDFINFLFHIWTQYAMLSHYGVMMPYKDDWLYNRINYNTRIYRFVMDPSKTYIVDMAMTGASIPINTNKSVAYEYTKDDSSLNKQLNQSTIQFHSNGVYMMDPIIFKQFNKVVEMFCPQMNPQVRKKHFVELSGAMKPYFVHNALPYINLTNAKLSWYVDKQLYKSELKILGD